MPEDAYQGVDITGACEGIFCRIRHKYVEAESADRRKALVEFALPKNMCRSGKDLLQYRIKYDPLV